uniref:Kielin cysteine rich BMP regulator n=1 Tax=Hippocampus comes TaxID=109280 RepID=A0A3Q3D7A8_HIPCM
IGQRMESVLVLLLDILWVMAVSAQGGSNEELQLRVRHLEGCECVRRSCVWEGAEVENGRRWQTDISTVCTCTAGTVTCQANIRGTCICAVLKFHVVLWPQEGDIRCERAPCPPLPCTNPAPPPHHSCCPVCEGVCVLQGKSSLNHRLYSLTFRMALQRAFTALQSGNVVCHEEKCPPHTALNGCYHLNPHAECVLDGSEYEDGSERHPEDPCSSCKCEDGDPQCTRIHCPPITCLHPTKTAGSCCAACDSCTYHRRIYGNGQTFGTPEQPCHICTCLVTLNCSNPYTVPGECCPKCPDCLLENHVFVDGQAFPNPTSACEECKCASGAIDCRQAQCPRPHCNAPLSGACCRNDCNGCSYAGKEHPNGHQFAHPTDPCRTCSCINGNVQCLMKRCPPLSCSNPHVLPGDCCPQCPAPPLDCELDVQTYRHGERFYSPSDRCQLCSCANGTVHCQRKPCPFDSCSHPVTRDCCRTCQGCLYEGRERANGEMWDDASDPCAACVCHEGSVRCEKKRCPPSNCKHPVQRHCCKSCDACLYNGKEHGDGTEFADDKDPCVVCYCYNGDVVCQRRPCPVRCSHPVPSEACCPVCDSCLYEGLVRSHGLAFAPSSEPCQRCTCVRGTVTCVPLACPPAPCSRAVTMPGQCCPECTGTLRTGGRCSSTAGEVQCASPQCPKLACMHQLTEPAACCPRCRGCMYDGVEYAEGSSWFADSSQCRSCMCVDGVTTCSEIRCLSPCSNFIKVPGECCPMCADCVFEGKVYGPGDSFHPAGDPCQVCTCEVMPGGEQHLRCYRKQCPSLVDCPKNNILFSGPDACCPVCAQPLSNCTSTLIGNEVLATDDPCFTCHCRDQTWTCLHRGCPPLTCPPSEQFTPPDSCCPVYWAVSCVHQGTVYQAHEQWQVDECTGCTCVSGEVHCHSERCPPLSCNTDEMPSVVPGLCCPHCIPRPATCIAFGDPHYRTFDGRMLHFQGTCTYVLAQDCHGGDFSIHATNEDRGRQGVSWTKEVTVFIGDVTVQLLQDWLVKVDDETVTLPFLREPYIYLERKGNTILLNSNIGLKVQWNGRSHLEVSVPGSYKGLTCGLCGNFNNYHQDDLGMPSGQISLSEADFGNSWRVTNGSHSLATCRPGEDVDPCREAGYHARKSANARCKVLKTAAFRPCHRVVPPEAWYAACVYDLCACGANTDECLCDALEAYAGQCREAGVVLQWRGPSLCAVRCPVERGFVFDECGPPCAVTCLNVGAPLGVLESHCFKPCVPGCQCPAGLVLHNNYCIHPSKCPKIIHGNQSARTTPAHQPAPTLQSRCLFIYFTC